MKNMNLDFSIVICTYNPDPRILGRCLAAVDALNKSALDYEIILVDNNSTVPLAGQDYIERYRSRLSNFQVLLEPEQGLTPARMAGINAAAGRHVVFFDDDNGPESHYLQELLVLIERHSHVVAWGPGNIDVDFIDGIQPGIEAFARSVFQERRSTHVEYANIRSWQACYPFGTGMCVRTSYLKEFARRTKNGEFTLPDRTGDALSSGGDVQIILFVLKSGAAAGISPGLKLTHIIPSKRANFEYIKRLLYAVYLGGAITILEVFPEQRDAILGASISKSKFSRRALKKYLGLLLNNKPTRVFKFIIYIASVSGEYLALKRPVPSLVTWIIRRMVFR